MLIIERGQEEALYLYTSDGLITVKVMGTRTGHVRLGIDSPATVVIHRDDIKHATAVGAVTAEVLHEQHQHPVAAQPHVGRR